MTAAARSDYEAVIADLEAQKAQIELAIAVVKTARQFRLSAEVVETFAEKLRKARHDAT